MDGSLTIHASLIAHLADVFNKRYTKIMKKVVVQRGRGRPNAYPDMILVRAPAGTREAIQRALKEGEKAADLIRTAISAELKRRRNF